MASSLSDESKTPGPPNAGVANALEPNAVLPHMAAGEVSNEQAWAAWKAKGKGSGRPPWWLVLLGLLALSVFYWLWGQGSAVTL